MNKTTVVIISGKKQSGKTSSFEFITSKLTDKTNKQYSFADPLKQFLMDVFGLTNDQCNGTDEQKNSLTKIKWADLPMPVEDIVKLIIQSRDPKSLPKYERNVAQVAAEGINMLWRDNVLMTAREVMQVFGSNICRKMYGNCWAEATLRKIQDTKPDYAFITDARFPNEIDTFLELDPIVIRLNRNPFDSKHVSETAMDDFDWTKLKRFVCIDNANMTLDEKNEAVYQAFLQLDEIK